MTEEVLRAVITEDHHRPIRNTSRNIAKAIEWLAALSSVAVIFDNFGIVKSVSSIMSSAVRKIIDFFPNLVEIVAHVPLPNFITQAIANTKIAQDFNVLLNLVAIWGIARIIATIFRLLGAQRSKIENIIGIITKGIIILVLLSEGVKFVMGGDTVDLFRGLIPFSTERGGDVPGWLSNSNLREMAWAVSSSITGVLVGGWAYMSNIRPERKKKQEQEELMYV